MVWPPAATYVTAKIVQKQKSSTAPRVGRKTRTNPTHTNHHPTYEREKRERRRQIERETERKSEREREREHGDVVKTIGFTNISKQTQPMCQFALSSLRMKM
jgi:hypothetical protein